jgi:hypothetical protein
MVSYNGKSSSQVHAGLVSSFSEKSDNIAVGLLLPIRAPKKSASNKRVGTALTSSPKTGPMI